MEWSRLLLWVKKKKFNGKDVEDLSQEDQRRAADIEKIWEATKTYKSDYEPDAAVGLARFKTRLSEENSMPITRSISPSKTRYYRQWLARAASVAALISIGVAAYYLWSGSTQEFVHETFADQIEEVVLPDGSTVVLNENSRIALKWKRSGGERKIQFTGEAFFDVTHDPSRPFIIETSRSQTTVLGTSFNLRDKKDESFAEVEVVTGKVRFEMEEHNMEVLPKHRVAIDVDGNMKTREAVNLNADSWMNQELSFRKSPLRIVLEDIQRHFSTQIKFDQVQSLDCLWNTSYQGETIEEVLKTIEKVLRINFEKTGSGTYLASGGIPCQD